MLRFSLERCVVTCCPGVGWPPVAPVAVVSSGGCRSRPLLRLRRLSACCRGGRKRALYSGAPVRVLVAGPLFPWPLRALVAQAKHFLNV